MMFSDRFKIGTWRLIAQVSLLKRENKALQEENECLRRDLRLSLELAEEAATLAETVTKAVKQKEREDEGNESNQGTS